MSRTNGFLTGFSPRKKIFLERSSQTRIGEEDEKRVNGKERSSGLQSSN
jgi:hypothetical protein